MWDDLDDGLDKDLDAVGTDLDNRGNYPKLITIIALVATIGIVIIALMVMVTLMLILMMTFTTTFMATLTISSMMRITATFQIIFIVIFLVLSSDPCVPNSSKVGDELPAIDSIIFIQLQARNRVLIQLLRLFFW